MLVALSLALTTSPAIALLRSSQSSASTGDSQSDENAGVPQQQQQQTPLQTNQAGRTARSSVGQAGQRQTRDTVAEQAGIKPMARIVSRIQNRVQNRIRNRIDRNFSPKANATDPFVVAEDQVRKSGRPR
ncbi:hypothetical protein M9978_21075 [Sphingomonas sp. MG17]|uniref:Uncharacterized protein n=1 Tax=Sphingomonas tagetis TaxID=2949092 RepID=A0A9X2KRL3_9SPHN|nr:hypothetical protein [Sphingomonas tagetis]MCP3732913.1 hypothetical protein [Sphingomonas tagetis]